MAIAVIIGILAGACATVNNISYIKITKIGVCAKKGPKLV
jgi:hypothetical protein